MLLNCLSAPNVGRDRLRGGRATNKFAFPAVRLSKKISQVLESGRSCRRIDVLPRVEYAAGLVKSRDGPQCRLTMHRCGLRKATWPTWPDVRWNLLLTCNRNFAAQNSKVAKSVNTNKQVVRIWTRLAMPTGFMRLGTLPPGSSSPASNVLCWPCQEQYLWRSLQDLPSPESFTPYYSNRPNGFCESACLCAHRTRIGLGALLIGSWLILCEISFVPHN